MAATRRLRLRTAAVADVESAVDWYILEASPEVAWRFVDGLETACAHISRHPGTGSLRWAQEPGLPGLRMWALKGFPYLVFHVEVGETIDVWRVLHASRDIPAWLEPGL